MLASTLNVYLDLIIHEKGKVSSGLTRASCLTSLSEEIPIANAQKVRDRDKSVDEGSDINSLNGMTCKWSR